MRVGEVFSRERLQGSVKAISDRLGMEGYAFANVNAVPEIDREKRQAAFTIYLDPGRRVYIRKINISGNVRTRDEVIRREMRQLESAWYDGARIERSKVRIRRLGYFDDVNIETPPVTGTTDQADVEVTVTERATGNLLAGIGYSSSDKLVFNASVSQQNIFGSGNALTAGINTSSVNRTHRGDLRRALLDGRRRFAHAGGLPAEPGPVEQLVGRAVRVVDAGAGRSVSASRSRRPTRSTSASASSTRI